MNIKRITKSNCIKIALELWKRLSGLPDNKQNKRTVLKEMGYININNGCPLCEVYYFMCRNLKGEVCPISCMAISYGLCSFNKTKVNAKIFYEELKQKLLK
jgi:hypothetical protein